MNVSNDNCHKYLSLYFIKYSPHQMKFRMNIAPCIDSSDRRTTLYKRYNAFYTISHFIERTPLCIIHNGKDTRRTQEDNTNMDLKNMECEAVD
jgi:hypothetical protein